MTYNHVHYHTIQHSSEYYRPATPNAAIKKIQPVSQRYAHLRLQTAWASRPRFPRSSSFLFLFIVVEIQFPSISVPLQFQFNSSPTSISIQSESSPPHRHPLTANRRSPRPAVSLVRQLGLHSAGHDAFCVDNAICSSPAHIQSLPHFDPCCRLSLVDFFALRNLPPPY